MTSAKCRADIRRLTLACLLVLGGGVFLVVLGCSTGRSRIASTAPTAPTASDQTAALTESSIKYSDLDGFDRSLSQALKQSAPGVTVQFVAPTTVNEIPTRMDKWLAMVEKYGGKVEAAPDPDFTIASRGLITDVVSLVIGAYNLAKEKILYGPSKEYNAIVYYDQGTGRITRVVFSRKKADSST